MADRVRMNTLSPATTALSQTPAFWPAGADLLRSKGLDRSSYDSGDWSNRLDWTGVAAASVAQDLLKLPEDRERPATTYC